MKKINYFRFNSLATAIVCSGVIFTSVLTSQAEVRTTKFDSPITVALESAIDPYFAFCFSPDFKLLDGTDKQSTVAPAFMVASVQKNNRSHENNR